MPKGYIIGHIKVTDPEGYPEYIRRDTPILESHGARFVVRVAALKRRKAKRWADTW